KGIGFWPAALLLSAYFGYNHYGNPEQTWLGAVNAGAGGLLFCLFRRKTGDLWMAIGFHTAWNWAESFLYGVANSGRTVPGQLLHSTASGPAWLSGGTVGPEGSLLCTLLLILAAALFLRLQRPTGAPQMDKIPAGSA